MVVPIELGSLESLAVDIAPSLPPFESSQLPASVDSVGLVDSVTLSSLSGQVDETGVFAPNSESLFGKKICDLLVDLGGGLFWIWQGCCLRPSEDNFGWRIHEGGKIFQEDKEEAWRCKENFRFCLIVGPILGCRVVSSWL